MSTQVIHVDRESRFTEAIRQAGELLQNGGLVAFPTETVYGVGARADDPAAVARLRAVKARDAEKGFTVHIAARDDAKSFVLEWPGLAERFARKAWPGPLTLILPVSNPSSAPIMAGLNGSACTAMYHHGAVGLRCPDDSVAHDLLRFVDAPIVAASANQAGHPAPWTGEDALRELDGRIDLLLDGGRTKYAKPSTIVRVTGSTYEVVREGVFDAGSVQRLCVVRLLFVCTGNTCRSPMAGRLAERLVAERLGCTVAELKARGVEIVSAGTAGGVGGASPYAIEVMARRGIDLSDHVSSRLSVEIVNQADYIFAMTRAHRDAIVRLASSADRRVQLLLDDWDVTDPMGGTIDDYEECARTVERGLQARLREVIL